jgi:hypothetical protein
MLRIGKGDRLGCRRSVGFALLIICLLNISFSLRAQLPGNVTITAITNWLKPESASCTIGNCNVTSITSVLPVAAERNGVAGINGPGTVTFETGVLNFNPSVRTINNDWFGIKRNTAAPKIQNSYTCFLVFKTAVVDSQPGLWYQGRSLIGAEHNGDESDFGVTFANGKLKYAHENGNDAYSMQPQLIYADGKTHLLAIYHEKGPNSDDSTQIYVDGNLIAADNSLNDPLMMDSIFFGSNLDHTSAMGLDADFGDILFYDAKVAGFNRDRIETYLALKYGITLGHRYKLLAGAGNVNLYAIDPIYRQGIIGVGKCTATLLDQRISESVSSPGFKILYGSQVPTGGLGAPYSNINNSFPAIVADDVFQIVGHDGGATTFTNPFNGVPNSKLGRTFKVADSNAGMVTLFFPSTTFTGLGNVTTPGPYYLVYGKDPQFGIGETFVPLIARTGLSNDYYVHIDFPNNDSTFFTIVRGSNVFAAPGGVAKGLELWLDGGKGVAAGPSVNAWNDQSGNDHNTACSCSGISGLSSAIGKKLNYRPFIEASALDRIWKTSNLFQGKTVFIVANAKQGGASQNGLFGFESGLQTKGLRSNGSNLIQRDGGATDWANGGTNGALLRENGTNVATVTGTILRKWSLLSSRRDSSAAISNRNFYLGGFIATERFDSMNVAEVIVYDNTLAGAGNNAFERVESYLAVKYGLTLTHKYRMSDWDGVANVDIYDPATYPFDIAGIGRDDNGRLYQRQGKTSDVDSLVSLALGSHFLYDTLNSNPIVSDKNFIMTGHDGGDISCWSTNEISVAGKRGIYRRVAREWKLQKTAGWGPEQVEFRVLADNPNANLPSLPVGASFVLITDNDNNFRDGNSVAHPMTLSSPGVYTVTLPTSTFPGPVNFFTIGTEMDSVLLGKPIKCVGNTFKVFGSRLGDVCTELKLSDGANNYFGVSGPAVTDTTFFIASNLPGGCVDTLLWRIPLVANPSNFDLLVDTTTGASGCNSTIIASNIDNARNLVDSILVDSSELANISWPGDSIYCANGPNVLPIIGTGTTVGLFSLIGGPLVGTPNLLMPNNNTGGLLVHSGSVGTHTIRYVTNGTFLCKDTAIATIKIRPITTPTISYVGSPYCGGNPFSDPAVISGTAGGTFSSAPGLVFSNTSTGVVDLPASAPGTYTIFYNPHVDSCANVASTTIVINAPERAYFDYPDSVLCLGAAQELPSIQYLPSSGSFTRIAGAGTLNVDPNTGAINLGTSSAGFYYVQYGGISGTCTYTAVDSFRIKAPTDATFNLANDTLCLNDPAFIPARTDPNGYFTSFNNLIGILVDSLTVNPAASTPGGPMSLFTLYLILFVRIHSRYPCFLEEWPQRT